MDHMTPGTPENRRNEPLSRRDFLKWSSVAGGAAVMAACAPPRRDGGQVSPPEITQTPLAPMGVETPSGHQLETPVPTETARLPVAQLIDMPPETFGRLRADFENNGLIKYGDSVEVITEYPGQNTFTPLGGVVVKTDRGDRELLVVSSPGGELHFARYDKGEYKVTQKFPISKPFPVNKPEEEWAIHGWVYDPFTGDYPVAAPGDILQLYSRVFWNGEWQTDIFFDQEFGGYYQIEKPSGGAAKMASLGEFGGAMYVKGIEILREKYDTRSANFTWIDGQIGISADGSGTKESVEWMWNGSEWTQVGALPENPADYGPEHNPQMFQHNGMWWNRTTDENGKFVWKAVYENGAPIEGMEYVTMEHFDLYLGNAHMFMVAYNLGDFHILVSPELHARLDFGKSGKTPEAIGQSLREALVAKSTNANIIAKLNAGAPAYAILGEKEDVWHMPCSPASVLKMRPIQSPDKSQSSEYICRDGNGYVDAGPLSEIDGSVVFGQFWLKRDYAQLNLIKPNSFELASGLENKSPLVTVASVISKGTLSEKWADIYGPQGGGKLVSEFAVLLSGFADIDWVASD